MMSSSLRKVLNTAYVIPACLWEKRMPFAPSSVIGALQRQRLGRIVRHAWKYVPFYRGVMKERGLTPSDIREPEDLRKLPLISNADMLDDTSIFNSRLVNPETDLLIRALN